MIRIIHLSDLHYSEVDRKDFETYVMKALLEDLNFIHSERPIDLIAISGDLINKGGLGSTTIMDAFTQFMEVVINPIKAELDLSNKNFIFCPGNHDMDQKSIDSMDETGIFTYLDNPDKINGYIDKYSDISTNHHGINRGVPYKKFENAFQQASGVDFHITNFHSAYPRIINGIKIGICSLNTAWRCSDSKIDKKRLLIGERQLTESLQLIEDCEFKLVLMHHPVDWLSDVEEKVIKTFLTRDFNMVCCGHVHEASSWTKTDMYGNLIVSVAPSNWTTNMRSTDRININGFTIIDYKRTEVDIESRRYSFLKGKYDLNTDQGDNGRMNYQLKCSVELQHFKYRTTLASKLRNSTLEGRNEHLLSYYTDTNAPKDIETIFVLPRLVNKIDFDVEKQKSVKHYNIDDICSFKKNLIIYGTKESGKTILMDRLMIEYLNNIEKYDIIPVYVDFQEYSYTNFALAVKTFLGISNKECEELLQNHKIVLLIDNLSFNVRNKVKIAHLEAILANPNVHMIGTITTKAEGEIPLDLLEYPTFTTFESLILERFRTKEIKELMKKWFSQNTGKINHSEYYDKLIKVFKTYNLPSTPLAVSMFLWIIEQQETYQPVNNAAMLENFIERIFKKSSKRIIYSSSFDYANKEHLLAEVAYEMYKINEDNYRMEHNSLRIFTHEYLKKRKFEFDEDEILKELFDNGIILKENVGGDNYIRFRFNCFFQYYMMKKIEFDQSFREHVLLEENYLNFVEELDYYTALKRGEVDILKLVYERMITEYQPILDIIENVKKNPLGFDGIFETRNSMAEKNVSSSASITTEITKLKPSEKDIDDMNDELLDGIKPETGIPKKLKLTTFDELGNLWILAAKLLKNTEETSNGDDMPEKAQLYKDLLKCSMAFSALYKSACTEGIRKAQEKKENVNEQLVISNRILPLLNQTLLHSLIASRKLTVVLREKIEADNKNPKISDYERFLSVFCYADIRGNNYSKYISEFVKKMRRNYIYDMTFLKIISYYILRSKSAEEDNLYLNLLGETEVKIKGDDRASKGKYITKYIRMKRMDAKSIASNMSE